MFEPGVYSFTVLEGGDTVSYGQIHVLEVAMPHVRCRFDRAEVIFNTTASTFIKASRVGDLPAAEARPQYDISKLG